MIPGKKKVFHIIQSLDNGGCENMLLRTLPLVDDFEHTIITLKELGELTPRFVEANIRVVNVHCKNLFDIPGLLRLRTLVKEENPDLVLSYLFHADMASRLVLSISPVPFLRTTYNHPKYFIARFLEWLTKPFVKHYLANSKAVKDFYVRHLGVIAKKITVIPNGVDINSFASLTPNLALKESLTIGPDDFVIICVANLHPNKGHRFLLEAFESLWQEFPHIRLLLIGDGEERENIQAIIQSFRSKDAIRLLGRRNDVPSLLKLSDLFVLPTLFEGQSNAILEAMAAGVTVITTDIPENRTFIDNGKNGILVPPEDIDSLKRAISEVLTDPSIRHHLTTNARAAVSQSHSLLSIRDQWNAFLKSI